MTKEIAKFHINSLTRDTYNRFYLIHRRAAIKFDLSIWTTFHQSSSQQGWLQSQFQNSLVKASYLQNRQQNVNIKNSNNRKGNQNIAKCHSGTKSWEDLLYHCFITTCFCSLQNRVWYFSDSSIKYIRCCCSHLQSHQIDSFSKCRSNHIRK